MIVIENILKTKMSVFFFDRPSYSLVKEDSYVFIREEVNSISKHFNSAIFSVVAIQFFLGFT